MKKILATLLALVMILSLAVGGLDGGGVAGNNAVVVNGNGEACVLGLVYQPGGALRRVAVDGWKTLWDYCAGGKSGGDDYKYGFDPLNKGDVQVSTSPPGRGSHTRR